MTNIASDNNKYWYERWKNKDTAFDQKLPNQFLVKHLPKIKYSNTNICFVPLCGSSIDMLYLEQQGFKVVGVEISEQAILQFFNTHNIPYKKNRTINDFKCFYSNKIKIVCADILEINLDEIDQQPVLWYDRGGYVALPNAIRESYAKKMIEICGHQTQILLNTTIHDGNPEQPPFSITQKELKSTFNNQINFELIEHYQIPELPEEKIQQGRSFQEYNIYIGNRKG